MAAGVVQVSHHTPEGLTQAERDAQAEAGLRMDDKSSAGMEGYLKGGARRPDQPAFLSIRKQLRSGPHLLNHLGE